MMEYRFGSELSGYQGKTETYQVESHGARNIKIKDYLRDVQLF